MVDLAARGLFDDLSFGDGLLSVFGMGSWPEPPESVPLRILGLDAMPTRDAVKSAFRSRVMAAHPDLAAYTIPHLRQAAEMAVSQTPEVQELTWARDVLLRKTPVTANPDSHAVRITRYEPEPCPGCGEIEGRGLVCAGRWDGYHLPCARHAENARQRQLRADRRTNLTCEGCGERFTPKRADGRYCKPACRQSAHRQRKAAG